MRLEDKVAVITGGASGIGHATVRKFVSEGAKVLVADINLEQAEKVVAEIEAGGPGDEFYDAKVKVLQEQIEHHVEEEEQRVEGMFSQARKAGVDMDALGEELAARKAELIANYTKSGLPKPELTTMSATKKMIQ